MIRRGQRRKLVDKVAEAVVTAAGWLSVAVLFGIFTLLLAHAVLAFGGGVEMKALSPAERASLPQEAVAELDARRLRPPALGDVLSSAEWAPSARAEPSYGILGLLASTALTSVLALVAAVPIGLAAAGWLAFGGGTRGRFRGVVKLFVEWLAAVPSVVVGFVGLELLGPWLGELFGRPGGLSALNGGLLLGVMALPTVVSLSEDALSAVPRALVEGSLALGADRWQTLLLVVAPAARSGLFAAVMLGLGRAIGETMTVLMATGNAAALPASLMDPVRTLTATLAIELGEVPRGTTHYFMLFGLGLLLFLLTLAVNLAADHVQRRGDRNG
mgnify:CR=1 FL=1